MSQWELEELASKQWFSSGIRIPSVLQSFLNATPDFIPIVITAEKYLLEIEHDVELL